MRVHERGAGITEACGTGACAAAWAAARWGLATPDADREITVHMDGGAARVRLIDAREVVLIGPATYIASIEMPMSLIERPIRERIVLVGVTLPPDARTTPRPASTSWPCSSTPPGPTRRPGWCSAATRPTPPTSSARARPRSCKEVCLAVDADTVVFDNELTPAQQYNLEKLLGRTAIDRTAVILDIFAQNAHTLEGKAQVELALYRYRLPRLRRGVSAAYTRQAGGIGTRRGPGRDQARGRSAPHHAPHHQARARAAGPAPHPPAPAQAPPAAAAWPA